LYILYSWINELFIDVWFVMIGQYLKIWNLRKQKNLNIDKIIFKFVQIKFLAMHITNQKLRFDIYSRKCIKYLQGTWSLLNILMILGIKEKNYNFDPYNIFLSIAINISQRLKTAFVLQGHICVHDLTHFWWCNILVFASSDSRFSNIVLS